MRDSVLASFAILNVNWDEGGTSYIHNFIPFVADCLKKAPADVVSAAEVQGCLRDCFSLNIPQPAIQGILSRAARDGLVGKERGVFVRDNEALRSFNLGPKRERALRDQAALVQKFASFVEAEFSRTASADEAEAMLLSYIADRSLPILQSIIVGERFEAELVGEEETAYLVSSFVARIFESDPDGFAYLETVVKGSMLATSVYLPGMDSPGRKITDLTIYLDTPFLLEVLGYEGDAVKAAAIELIELLKSLGGRLACYDHTARELRGVLSTAAKLLRSPGQRYGRAAMPIVEHCLTHKISGGSLDLRIENLERDLNRFGIATIDSSPYEASTTLDEAKLEELLQQYVGYYREETRLNDLRSLTATYRARGGKTRRAIEDSKAIFVTPNVSVVRASREFFGEQPDGQKVPICALDHELATIAWLKQPVKAPELPRKQILADCYAAMYPNEALWRRYVEEVDTLRGEESLTEDDYFVLRFSVEARRALMHETLGRENAFSSGMIEDVLKRANETQQRVLLRRLRDTMEAVDREREAREEAEQARVASERAAEEIAKKASEEALEREIERGEHLNRIARRYARGITRPIYGVVIVLVGVGVVFSLPRPFPAVLDGRSQVVTLLGAAILFVLAGFGFANLWVGVSVRNVARRVEECIERRIRRRLEDEFTERPGH